MSISPETSPRASPSNSELAGALACRRAARRGDRALGFYTAVALLAGVAIAGWRWSARLRETAPAVSYEAARPGDQVVWCVDHTSKDSSYVDGKPSHALRWVNEGDVPNTHGPTSGGRCERMRIEILERRPDVLILRYLGSAP